MTADLAVIVVTFNSEDYLDPCLGSVAAIEGLNVEVVVVDNASTDRTIAVAQRWASSQAQVHVQVIANDSNAGFGRANNQGVAACDAPLVLLLNPDAVLAPGAAETLVALQHSRPDHGLYGGVTHRTDGSVNEHTLRKLPSVFGTVAFGFGLSAVHPLLAVEQLPVPERVDTAPMVTGSLLLIDRGVWNELGGFDERFFMYSEDADLCQRAVDRGYVPLVHPEAVVVHDGGASSPDTGRKIAMMMAGRATYVRLHWSGPARWLALSALYGGVGIRAAADRLLGKQAWVTAWRSRSWWLAGYREGAPLTPPA